MMFISFFFVWLVHLSCVLEAYVEYLLSTWEGKRGLFWRFFGKLFKAFHFWIHADMTNRKALINFKQKELREAERSSEKLRRHAWKHFQLFIGSNHLKGLPVTFLWKKESWKRERKVKAEHLQKVPRCFRIHVLLRNAFRRLTKLEWMFEEEKLPNFVWLANKEKLSDHTFSRASYVHKQRLA